MTTLRATTLEMNPNDQIDQKGEGMTLIAYRMQKAEEAIKEGFKEQAAQIEKITSGFVTTSTFEEAKLTGKEEHNEINDRIDKLYNILGWVVKSIIGALIAAGIAALIAL